MRLRSSPGRTTSTYSSSYGSDAAEEDDDDAAAAGVVPGNAVIVPGVVGYEYGGYGNA